MNGPSVCPRCQCEHCCCPQLGDPFDILSEVDFSVPAKLTGFDIFLLNKYATTKDGTK